MSNIPLTRSDWEILAHDPILISAKTDKQSPRDESPLTDNEPIRFDKSEIFARPHISVSDPTRSVSPKYARNETDNSPPVRTARLVLISSSTIIGPLTSIAEPIAVRSLTERDDPPSSESEIESEDPNFM
jgi:hypothetical protein